MKYIKSIYLGVLATIVVSSAAAQIAVPADLAKCLERGLASNYELQIVKTKEQQATNRALYLNSGALPTVGLAGGYGVDADNVRINPHNDERSKFQQADQAVDLGVGVDWTLFDGFKIRASHERFEELERQSKVSTRIAIEDYIANLAAEYYNYIQQHNRLMNLSRAVDLSRERLRIVRARYMVGSFSRLDYQQANVDFYADSANYIKQREVFKRSGITLNELMAVGNTDTPVAISDTLIVVNSALLYDELLAEMETNNAELISAEHGISISKLDYKKVIARNYPYAKLSADYGYIRNMFGRGANESNSRLGVDAGINIGITLFDTKRRTDRRDAELAVKIAELNEYNVALKLNSQFNNLWQAYENNLGLLHLERSSLGAAKENYEIAKERYMLGDLSGIEMREAQNSLLDAEDRILIAKYDAKICEISLLQISGQIIKYLGE